MKTGVEKATGLIERLELDPADLEGRRAIPQIFDRDAQPERAESQCPMNIDLVALGVANHKREPFGIALIEPGTRFGEPPVPPHRAQQISGDGELGSINQEIDVPGWAQTRLGMIEVCDGGSLEYPGPDSVPSEGGSDSDQPGIESHRLGDLVPVRHQELMLLWTRQLDCSGLPRGYPVATQLLEAQSTEPQGERSRGKAERIAAR
jgi:hypothetical protein